MMKYADLIDEHIEELAALDAIDAGKLFSGGIAVDIPNVARLLRYYAGAADKIHGEVLKMSRELHGYTLREPIGVAGHIIPWNFPSSMFFMMSAPALAAGCTMIVKPAEQTPLSALFYGHLAKQVSLASRYCLLMQNCNIPHRLSYNSVISEIDSAVPSLKFLD
jgi:coniferyl-aldehyde dehydrogenase